VDNELATVASVTPGEAMGVVMPEPGRLLDRVGVAAGRATVWMARLIVVVAIEVALQRALCPLLLRRC
jgi:hypothetical protein